MTSGFWVSLYCSYTKSRKNAIAHSKGLRFRRQSPAKQFLNSVLSRLRAYDRRAMMTLSFSSSGRRHETGKAVGMPSSLTGSRVSVLCFLVGQLFGFSSGEE
jgi:hypothetical protein